MKTSGVAPSDQYSHGRGASVLNGREVGNMLESEEHLCSLPPLPTVAKPLSRDWMSLPPCHRVIQTQNSVIV